MAYHRTIVMNRPARFSEIGADVALLNDARRQNSADHEGAINAGPKGQEDVWEATGTKWTKAQHQAARASRAACLEAHPVRIPDRRTTRRTRLAVDPVHTATKISTRVELTSRAAHRARAEARGEKTDRVAHPAAIADLLADLNKTGCTTLCTPFDLSLDVPRTNQPFDR